MVLLRAIVREHSSQLEKGFQVECKLMRYLAAAGLNMDCSASRTPLALLYLMSALYTDITAIWNFDCCLPELVRIMTIYNTVKHSHVAWVSNPALKKLTGRQFHELYEGKSPSIEDVITTISKAIKDQGEGATSLNEVFQVMNQLLPPQICMLHGMTPNANSLLQSEVRYSEELESSPKLKEINVMENFQHKYCNKNGVITYERSLVITNDKHHNTNNVKAN